MDIDKSVVAKVEMGTRNFVDVGKGNLVVESKLGKRERYIYIR